MDWLLAAIDDVERTCQEACDALLEAMQRLEPARRMRERGEPMSAIVGALMGANGRGLRMKSAERFSGYEHAVMKMRGQIVRALVDDEKMTLTEVGKLLQISRQMTTRLYRRANAQ